MSIENFVITPEMGRCDTSFRAWVTLR